MCWFAIWGVFCHSTITKILKGRCGWHSPTTGPIFFSHSFISSCLGFSLNKSFWRNQMIFGRDRVSCDDFGNCHDEIVIAVVDFIGRWPTCGLYLQGRPQWGQLLWDIDLIAVGHGERKSRFGGYEFASYAIPDDATADILSSIQLHFGLVPKRWILRHVHCFRVGL